MQVFYVETISNPLLEVPDIPAVAAFCQQHGITSVIDNTFASPVVFRSVHPTFLLSVMWSVPMALLDRHSRSSTLSADNDALFAAVST